MGVDARHALLGRPTAVSLIATLSIAIGAAAVVFAAVKAILIEPFPHSHPEALLQIRTGFGPGVIPPRQE